jgi:hypothetical protein
VEALTEYPESQPWYQTVLDIGWLKSGVTAASIVALHLDMSLFRDLEEPYRMACRKLERLNERVGVFTAQHGFEVEGKKYICPLMIEALLSAFPENEPPPEEISGKGGAPGIPFEPMLRAVLLAPFYEVQDNGAAIWRALQNNPNYLLNCGFPENRCPSERMLQYFRAVMNFSGLWAEARRRVVRDNIEQGRIEAPRSLAIDPTHKDGFATVGKACKACRLCQGCDKQDRYRTCDVTDIIAKRATFQFPGAKSSVVADADTELPLLAVPVHARPHDSKSGELTARAFAAEYPELVEGVQDVALDGAYDNVTLKDAISEVFGGADVLVPINPRARKPIKVQNARGIDHVDPYGVPHCIAGLPMRYLGRDLHREQYRFGCPQFDTESRMVDCTYRGACCPNPGTAGRQFRVHRTTTPQVDWNLPQHSADFTDRYPKRTSVERSISRDKRSFPFERHWGRGRSALAGHLDRGVLAVHVLVHAAHRAGKPEKFRSVLTFHKATPRGP